MKIAMVKVFALLKERGLKSRMLLQVHDEILIETAPGEEEDVRKILSEGMKNAAKLLVPLKIDIETGMNWFDAK
jgi:DNA polymerase-1